ncbi:hypothetical protein [Streptomyces sp. NPDC085596]|uniref:hypothetical protein n=1 Tax=Streptomyces sp. NPDC085596 TaxID=3365731 RepID=UPI0037D0A9D8
MINQCITPRRSGERAGPAADASASPFDLESVVAAARRGGGGADVTTRPRFLAAFRRLTASLADEADLSPEGVAVARRRLVSSLARQTRVRELIETGQVDPEPHGNDVVFVVGLPGTGLSSLRRMLSHHPAFNIPTLREILSPTTDRGAWADTGVLQDDPFEHALWARLGEHGSHRTPTLEAPSSDHLLQPSSL